MIIRHLQISNFRKFVHLDLEFPDGVIGVVGRNGSGKSTLLEIFAWLLYGSNALKTKNIQIFPDFLPEKGQTSGELTFLIGDRRFRLERSFQFPSKSTAMLYLEEKLLAAGTKEVNAEIEKLSGLDWKAFQTSFYTRQNELNLLGSLQVSERGKRLEEMLGLEKTLIIINNIKGDLRALEGEIRGLEILLPKEEEYRSLLLKKSADADTISGNINGLSERLAASETLLQDFRQGFIALEKKREAFLSLKSELALNDQALSQKRKRLESLQQQITSIEAQVPEFEQLKGEVQALPDWQRQLNELEQEQLKYETARHHKKRLEELNIILQEQLQKGRALSEEIEKLQNELKKHDIIINNIGNLRSLIELGREQISGLTARRAALAGELDRLQNQMHNIDLLGPEAVCSFCLRPFKGEMDNIRTHFLKELARLESEKGTIDGELQKARDSQNRLVNQEQQAEDARKQAFLLGQKIAQAEGERKSLRENYKANLDQKTLIEKELSEIGEVLFEPRKFKTLKDKVQVLQDKNSRYSALVERISALDRLKAELAGDQDEIIIINNNINQLQVTLKALEFSEEAFITYKKQLEHKGHEVDHARQGLSALKETAAGLNSEIRGLQENLKNIESSKIRIGEVIAEKIYLESLIELLKELKIELASRIRPLLIRLSSHLLDLMTDGKFSELDLNENYEISIRDYGELRELGRFSGGEQDLANLCLRLAISRLLAQSSRLEAGFLILDEIFGSQDGIRKENILGAITGLQDFFQQIFMVTHVDDIKDAVQTLITVEETPAGSSFAVIE